MDMNRIPLSGWVWTGDPDAALNTEVQIVYFRKTLELTELPQKFTADLSADSRYKFYVNGQMVEVGPAKGDAKVWFYETVDLLPYLTVGENVLSAIVLRYPLVNNKGNHSIWRTEVPGFCFKGHMTTADGVEQELLAGDDWSFRKADHVQIVSEGKYFAPLQVFENTAGRAWTLGWQRAGYKAEGWSPAVPYMSMQVHKAVSPGNLLPRPIPSMFQKEQKFAGIMTLRESGHSVEEWNDLLAGQGEVTIPAHTKEIVEINAGELTTGYLQMKMREGAGAKLHIVYAEAYVRLKENTSGHGPAMIEIKRDRMDCENGVLNGYADDYEVAGYGQNCTESDENVEYYEPFWFRAFRFIRLEIETGDTPLTLCQMDYRETGYPLEIKTHAETSDPDMAGIWDISERSLRRCMHETYEDCPYYEQLQYIMDSRSQMLYTYRVSADDRLARKCMDDFKRSARYDGLLNCSYPSYGPNVIPGFSIYYIMMVYDHMMYFGDKGLVSYHMPTIDGILEYFRRSLNEHGLVGIGSGGYLYEARYWSFIDWVTEWRVGVPNSMKVGAMTMESFLYIYGLQHAAKLARYLGRDGLAEEYENRAAKVQEAVRAHCMGANGLYQDGPGFEEYSQHSQVFAVLTGTADKEEGYRILKEVTDSFYCTPEELESGAVKRYPRCSVSMSYYLFRALEQVGLYERTERLWDIWREMVQDNLTTCVESKENGEDGRSDCHAWGSLILFELPAVILGIRPTAPGFEEWEVEPVPGYLTAAKGDVVTPKGMIHVEWTRQEDGSLKIFVE